MSRIPVVMLVALISMVAVAGSANTLIVAEVHSGDLVEFDGGFSVHLAGVTVPARDSLIGQKAYSFVKDRLEGKRVAVFTWTTDNTAAGIVCGEDGLAFAKVTYGRGLSVDIATELLERGWAKVDSIRLPAGYDHYLEIELRAKAQQLGIWATAEPAPLR